MPFTSKAGLSRRRGLGSRLLLSGLLGTLLTGCGSFIRQPENVEVTRSEVETMRRDQTELLALVRELKLRLESLNEDVASSRADENVERRQLNAKIDMLLRQFEEQGHRPETRNSGAMATPPPPDTTRSRSDPGAVPPASPSALYDAAQRDFAAGNYQLAMDGYDDFLKLSPESDEADDAQYWIGESFYSLGDMDRAVQEFLKVRDIYPDGDKVAAATLKIGYAFLRKGDCATSRRYFETVVTEYPGSNEASLAKDKLKERC